MQVRSGVQAMWGLTKSRILVNMSRRSNYALESLSLFFRAFIVASLWSSIGDSGPVSSSKTIAYTVIAVGISSLAANTGNVEAHVRSGNIVFDMRRPCSLLLHGIANGVGAVLARLPQLMIGLLGLSILVDGVSVTSGRGLAYASGVAVIGIANAILLNHLIDVSAFWFINLNGVRALYFLVTRLASGALVPLWFMPGPLQTALPYLPFASAGYLPAALAVGDIDVGAAPIVTQVLWLIVLGLAAAMMSSRGVRRLVVQGG